MQTIKDEIFEKKMYKKEILKNRFNNSASLEQHIMERLEAHKEAQKIILEQLKNIVFKITISLESRAEHYKRSGTNPHTKSDKTTKKISFFIG